MKPLTNILEQRISRAIGVVTGQDRPALVRVSANAKFGDYQANGVMAAAKIAKTNPRQLAEQVVAALDVSDICEPPEIAGPGFINLRLKDDFLADRLLEMNADKQRLGIEKTENPQTVVVDYSGPNVAKEMHVGHLRSTIIGDCISRMVEFEGHTVIRQNHIGDWGTQFGKLIAHLEDTVVKKTKDAEGEPQLVDVAYELSDLDEFYKEASKRDETDDVFSKRARSIVADIHQSKNDSLWKLLLNDIIKISRRHYQTIYNQLNITLQPDDERGESFYADKLADVVETLKQKRLAVESDGAMCVFPEGFQNKEGNRLPFIIQKTDGAFLYATTDLAALRFRINELKAKKIIYVTDARQAQHFQMLFAVAKMAGWTDNENELVHVTFGTMLGEDNKPFKTRTGGTVKLKDLLEEAVQRAATVVEEKNPDLTTDQKTEIAKAVGIGAVKYADYSNNRNSDFIFSFDKMLAMEGNTAPYMQYAYARIQSIVRKGDIDIEDELTHITNLAFTDDAEKDLAKMLIRYDQAIDAAAGECRPNYLTGYLYDLAQVFSRFYNACPVLKADAKQQPLRLLLCELTARTIRHGMSELLGIDVVEQM